MAAGVELAMNLTTHRTEVGKRPEGAQEDVGATQRYNDQARELYLKIRPTHCCRSWLVYFARLIQLQLLLPM